jgi:hypothetical protein
MKRGGVRPGAGRKKGYGRWGDAETFDMRLPVILKRSPWFMQLVRLILELQHEAQRFPVPTKDKP